MWLEEPSPRMKLLPTVAEDNERKLDACLMDINRLDHDNGFRWLPTAVADYRMTSTIVLPSIRSFCTPVFLFLLKLKLTI